MTFIQEVINPEGSFMDKVKKMIYLIAIGDIPIAIGVNII